MTDIVDSRVADLRHGMAEVPVHEIANQGYCELQVELLHKHPHVVPASRMLENGNFGHAGLEQRDFDFKPMWSALRAGNPPLRASFGGVPLVGIPDYLVTGRDGVTLLLEYKVTRRAELYQSRIDQANTYGFLAEANEVCDPRRLVLGVVALSTLTLAQGRPMTPADTAKVRQEILKTSWVTAREILAKEIDRLEVSGTGWSAHLWPYDSRTARAALANALSYWRNEREPTDAREWKAKCDACPVNAVGLCKVAPAPTNAFEVSQRGGKLIVRRR